MTKEINGELYNSEEVLIWLANATKTYYGAHGHNKADRNEQACKDYKSILTEMNVPFPDTDELLKIGVFNDVGSK